MHPLLALLCLLILPGPALAAPNIILILSDDQSPDTISAYGVSPWTAISPTPSIDAIAGNGVRFVNSFVQNPVCQPSRATILTGRSASRHGVIDNGDPMQAQPTFPQLLKAAGYDTALFGKNLANFQGSATPAGFDWSNYDAGQVYVDPVTTLNGVHPHPNTGYATDLWTDQAIAWIDGDLGSRNPANPFFVFIGHAAPHYPIRPRADHDDLFPGPIPKPATYTDDLSGRSPLAAAAFTAKVFPSLFCTFYSVDAEARGVPQPPPGSSPNGACAAPKHLDSFTSNAERAEWVYQLVAHDYLQTIVSMDLAVDRLRDYLVAEGLAANTVVIFASDNGMLLGDHFRHGKQSGYEPSIRVPLLIEGPASLIPSGVVDTHLVSNLDWAPTILDIADTPIPDGMEGRSLLELLDGSPPTDWRQAVYYHDYPEYENLPERGIRADRYKLIEHDGWTDGFDANQEPIRIDWTEEELIDLQTDPDELTNQYANPAYAAVVQHLSEELHYQMGKAGEGQPGGLAAPSPACLSDAGPADFAAGSTGAGTILATEPGGGVTLAPTSNSEFDGSALPPGWSSASWAAGASTEVAGGALRLDGARAGSDALFGPGRALEFTATFAAAPLQQVGFGVSYESSPWAVFSTGGDGATLEARTNGASAASSVLGAAYLGSSHRFRIDWTPSAIEYRIDGALLATHPIAVAESLRPLASDGLVGGSGLVVDALRMTPYAAAGSYESRVADAGAISDWSQVDWTRLKPAGTSLTLWVRSGPTPTPDESWTAFSAIATPGASAAQTGRYGQYRVDLATSDPAQTPLLQDVTLACAPPPVCGDGVREGSEQCDDGNTEASDGCSPICAFEGPDADGDGIPNAYETGTGVYVSPTDTGTSPLDPDTDGDGASDGVERERRHRSERPGQLPAGPGRDGGAVDRRWSARAARPAARPRRAKARPTGPRTPDLDLIRQGRISGEATGGGRRRTRAEPQRPGPAGSTSPSESRHAITRREGRAIRRSPPPVASPACTSNVGSGLAGRRREHQRIVVVPLAGDLPAPDLVHGDLGHLHHASVLQRDLGIPFDADHVLAREDVAGLPLHTLLHRLPLLQLGLDAGMAPMGVAGGLDRDTIGRVELGDHEGLGPMRGPDEPARERVERAGGRGFRGLARGRLAARRGLAALRATGCHGDPPGPGRAYCGRASPWGGAATAGSAHARAGDEVSTMRAGSHPLPAVSTQFALQQRPGEQHRRDAEVDHDSRDIG